MSFLGNLLGTNSSYVATGAPGLAAPVTSQNATDAYTQAQQSLAAPQTQLGTANQTFQNAQGAYNTANNAVGQQQAFVNALNAQNGLQNQSNVANQLQSIASGQGPNPAQAMLNQATGANTANQAALMAGQRGASANPALIARLAAQQGAANQQSAAGQGATMQAQQSLGALGQLGGVSGQQVGQLGQGLAGLGQQAQGAAGLQQGNVQNALGLTGAAQGNTQLVQGQQNALLGQINAQNQADLSNYNTIQGINAGQSQFNAGQNANLIGGITGGLSGAAAGALGGGGAAGAAKGLAAAFADGGEVNNGPKSIAGRHIHGKVSSKVVDGEKLAAGSAIVPGKAEVKGNSLKNDKVKALLSPGEMVIPRNVMNSSNPGENAKRFVEAHMKRKGSAK